MTQTNSPSGCTEDDARELAYQAYITEVTPNGYERLANIILGNSGHRADQHIATQVRLSFQAGWQARADLAPQPDPLGGADATIVRNISIGE